MNKKTIKLRLLGFTSKIMEEGLYNSISKYYNIDSVSEPDYVIYWVYDYEHYNYDCIRILYTSECYTPDFNDCDYAIGFDRLNFGDRYIRVPLYCLFQYKENYQRLRNRKKYSYDDLSLKTGFCSFVVSNCFAKDVREQLFDKISEYKTVSSGGRFRNNIGGAVIDKFKFQRGHKFSIACENCSYDGYVTEKIMEAFASDTIPIYYGDPNISMDFNSKAFINVHDYNSLDEVVERVKEIDSNKDLYIAMLNEPIINPNAEIGNLDDFLLHIFEQPIDSARRRSHSQTSLSYESSRKRHKFFECYIYKYYEKILNHVHRIKTGTILTSKRTK